MIELTNVTKSFSKLCAVDQVSATIREGLIFGLVGSNGAGKSTLLRLISGILKADSGTITLDDEDIFEHPSVKQKICFLSDSIFFFQMRPPIQCAAITEWFTRTLTAPHFTV